MFFSFFKRSKARNSDKNEKQCSNEKQILPDTGASGCVSQKKDEKISKGKSTFENKNHCANSLVSALHLNSSPFVDDNSVAREIHLNHGDTQSVVAQQECQPQYYYNNLRQQNDLSKVVEVNVLNNNNNKSSNIHNNSNKGDDDVDRQKNDNNISKGSIERTSVDDSYDARALRDGARCLLSEPVSKFSPKLFSLRGKRGDKNTSTTGSSNFFNDFIMGKGRNRHRGARPNPVQVQQNQKQQKNAKNTNNNKQVQVVAHGSDVNDVKNKNNCNNGRNLPQKSNSQTTTLPEKRKNQGDKNAESTETLKNNIRDDGDQQQRDVVKNNTEDLKNHDPNVSKCSPDVNDGHDVTEINLTKEENFVEETSVNASSSFVNSLPSNEQGADHAPRQREDSNEFAPPEKKSKTCEITIVNQSDDDNDGKEVVVENLRENHHQLNSENCETDEMGQPNSKNGVNNNNNLNESSANFNSATSEQETEVEEAKTRKMGTDDTINGGQTQRATSPCGNNITKSVRFNDENLCSYADDIFYEANDSATGLDRASSLENLPNYFNNSIDEDDNNKINLISDDQKVPLVKCEDDDFDLIINDNNDDDDDDEITSTYEEAQSISVLVKDDEFFENIVQPLVTTNTNVQNEIKHDSSAFNDEQQDITTPKNNKNNEKSSIYNTNLHDDQISDDTDKSESMIDDENDSDKVTTDKNFTENCENIHSYNNHNDEIHNNNNKNLYMEDTISLPDIVESSHHNGIPVDELKIDEKSDKMGNEMRDLVNQESRYNAQLEAAQQKVNELKTQINDLERDISNKSGVQERLQAELEAANKDSETVRHKLRQQAEELERLKLESDDQTEEWKQKYHDLEKVHMETEDKLKSAQTLATSLQIQIADVRSDTEKCQLEKEKLMDEKTEEQKVLREALDKALKERNEIETKWKHDFEQLRNVNSDREERLMEDCEWKMRSMQKQCKEKLDNAEKERLAAVQKMMKIEEDCKRHTIELQNVKSYEVELNQLRNLTNGQHETIAQYRQQIDELKAELATVTRKLEDEIENCKDIKKRFELQLIEKEKDAINRIDIARGTIAMQWEDKLLEEMARLKMELEQIGLEEKQESLAKLRRETDEELTALTSTFTAKQEELEQEIASLKEMLEQKQKDYEELQAKSDTQMMETRQYLDRADRDNQATLDREIRKRESIIETMKQDHTQQVEQMEQKFNARLERLQEEYQRDLSDQTELLKSKHKRELEDQWKQLVAEKEEALQSIETRHKKKIEEAENHIRELITSHENGMKELQEAHTSERSALEKRDAKNVQEIDTLHKKCRCLTKLFEEMRMRYERRDPRPEDLRQITELKSIVEAQDRDLRILTERFREIQIYQQHQQNMMHSHSLPPYAQVVAQQQAAQQQQQQQQQQSGQQQPQMIPPIRNKSKSRTPVKQMPNGTQLPPPPPPPPISNAMMQMFNPAQAHMSPVCEVIYEENEENEQMNGHAHKERTPARMNGIGDAHIPPPVDQKAIVNDIINEVVASAHIQAHGLAESAF